MNKRFFLAALAAVALAMGFTACSDEDEPEFEPATNDVTNFYEIQFDNWDGFESEKAEAEAIFSQALGWTENYGTINGTTEEVAKHAAGIFGSYDYRATLCESLLISSFDFKLVSLNDGSTVYTHRFDRADRDIYGPFHLAQFGDVYYFSMDSQASKYMGKYLNTYPVIKVDVCDSTQFANDLDINHEFGCFYPTGFDSQSQAEWLSVPNAKVKYSFKGFVGVPRADLSLSNGDEKYIHQETYDTLSLNNLIGTRSNYEIEIDLSDKERKNSVTLTFAGNVCDDPEDLDNREMLKTRIAGLSNNAFALPECHTIPSFFLDEMTIPVITPFNSFYWHDNNILNTFKMKVNGAETTYTGCVNGQFLWEGPVKAIYVNLKKTPLQGELFLWGKEEQKSTR